MFLNRVDHKRAVAAPRVIHLISDAGPHPYFRTLIEAGRLDPSNLAVGCVGPAGALQRDMREIGVETFALDSPSRATYPMAVGSLARLLRAHRTEVLQTHLVDGSFVGLMAARLARTPVAVFTAHHSHELPFHGRKLVWADSLFTRLADHVIVPSRQVAETLMGFTNVPPAKIEVVHHGFDMAWLDPSRTDRQKVRAELGLGGEIVFGAIGRIYKLKNYITLIEAFADIARRTPSICLVIVGEGDPVDLLRRADELGIRSQVRTMGPRSDIPDVLAAFDVFVHPAIAESFGMVIVEAMAMARPVLSTTVGIAPEIIEDGRNGILVRSPDADDLAAGLARLLSLRSHWPEIAVAARGSVAGMTARAMAVAHEELYDRWLAGANDGPQSRRYEKV